MRSQCTAASLRAGAGSDEPRDQRKPRPCCWVGDGHGCGRRLLAALKCCVFKTQPFSMRREDFEAAKHSGTGTCLRILNTVYVALQKLWAEGGVGRFYRGFSPALLRAIPANGIMLLVVDKMGVLLNKVM